MRSRTPVLLITVGLGLAGCRPASDAEAAEPAVTSAAKAPGPAAKGGAPAQAASTVQEPEAPGHRVGRADAPIVVVEFSDFGCPYCARFARTTFPELRDDVVKSGMVRWRYVPVTFGFPGGRLMAAAAECAAEIGGEQAFWRMHDMLYRNQPLFREDDGPARLLAKVDSLGLERRRMETCLQSPTVAGRLQANNLAAQEWLVRGTPTFIINGVPTSGAMPTAFFHKMFSTLLDPGSL